MPRSLLLVCVAALLSLAASPDAEIVGPSESPVPTISAATHTVTITYGSRNATIRLEPRRGVRAPWRGAVHEGAVYSAPARRWTTFRFTQIKDGIYEATARLPRIGELSAFALLAEDRSSYAWVGMNPQVSEGDDDDKEQPKPDEPEPDEPEPDEPDEEGGLCNGIVDP